MAYLASHCQSGDHQPEALFAVSPERHLCISFYEKYFIKMWLVSSCQRQGVDKRNFCWFRVLYIIVLLSKCAALYIVAAFWRGNIFRILAVRLYVKCTRGAGYLKSYCSLSSLTWKFFWDVYRMQIQVFVTSSVLQGHTSSGDTVLYRIQCACSRKKIMSENHL